MGKKKPDLSGIDRHFRALLDSSYPGDAPEYVREFRALMASQYWETPALGALLYALAVMALQEQIMLDAADGGDLTTEDNALWMELTDMKEFYPDWPARIQEWVELAASATEESMWALTFPASCRMAARVLTGRAEPWFAGAGGS